MLMLNDTIIITEHDIALTWGHDGVFNNAPPRVSGKPWCISYVPIIVRNHTPQSINPPIVRIDGVEWYKASNPHLRSLMTNFIHPALLKSRGENANTWASKTGVEEEQCRRIFCGVLMHRMVYTLHRSNAHVFFENETDGVLMSDVALGWNDHRLSKSKASTQSSQRCELIDYLQHYYLVDKD